MCHCIKTLKFHLISWYGHFVETQSFRPFIPPENTCAFPQNLRTGELCEILVLYSINIKGLRFVFFSAPSKGFMKAANPVNINLFKVKNRNTRKRCEIHSKLTIKTPERRL